MQSFESLTDEPITKHNSNERYSATKRPYLVEACLPYATVNDGLWHTIVFRRMGHNLNLQLDSGEIGNRNQTSALDQMQNFSNNVTAQNIVHVFNAKRNFHDIPHTMAFQVDRRDGVTIGGIPVLDGVSILRVDNDLQECKYFVLQIYTFYIDI